MVHTKEHNYSSRIPAHVHACMEVLALNGYESYLVGGAVRDLLLGSTPADFDLASDATPLQMLDIFDEFKTLTTGIAHGTVTVIHSGRPVEITTYRVDGAYSDSRRPDNVLFSGSLEEDVKRRDFTINAMAMDRNGQIIDFVGGQDDLSNRIIRCVGDPDLRMQEDALRILRALRFSAVLGFPIEEKTRRSLFRYKKLLVRVSEERIWTEISGLICGNWADRVLSHYVNILGVVIPEILPMKGFLQHNPHHSYDVWEHTVRVVMHTPPQKNIRLAALFHDSGKPDTFVMDAEGIGHFYGHQKISRDIAHNVLLRLKSDTRTREQVETLVLWHDINFEPSEKIIRRRLNQFGEPMFRDLLTLKRADTLAQSEKSLYRLEEQAHIQELLEKILEENACFSMKDLALDGKDLLAIGVSPGQKIGEILQAALSVVIDGELANDRATLLDFARQMLANE
jgi:tRNA nucleotidyltransferase (CCA-adding enzyme)